mgnify:CR=1 FL=1
MDTVHADVIGGDCQVDSSGGYRCYRVPFYRAGETEELHYWGGCV